MWGRIIEAGVFGALGGWVRLLLNHPRKITVGRTVRWLSIGFAGGIVAAGVVSFADGVPFMAQVAAFLVGGLSAPDWLPRVARAWSKTKFRA